MKDLPILAQSLPAVCQAGLSAVFFTRLGRVYPPVVWRNAGQFSVKVAAVKGN